MDHRPDLAEEGCDQRVVEIYKYKNIIARFAGVFHRIAARSYCALSIGGTCHDRYRPYEVEIPGGICFVVGTDRQVQIPFVRLRCRVIFEYGDLPLLGNLMNGQDAGIILLSLVTIARAVWRSIILWVMVGTGSVRQDI